MTEYKHPMRKLSIKTYSPDQQGEPFIAYIGSVGKTAMHFTGATRDEAHDKAMTFKNEAIEQNETSYANRMKARDAAKKKKVTK